MTMLLKKISTKTVFGDKEEILDLVMKSKDLSHPIMRVVGIARALERGKSKFHNRGEEDNQNNEWIAFIGKFQAVNSVTGEVYNSPKCFLPAFAADIVAGQFSAENDVQAVEFAFDIGAHFNADAITSYEFDITPLIEQKTDDLDTIMLKASKKAPLQLGAEKA